VYRPLPISRCNEDVHRVKLTVELLQPDAHSPRSSQRRCLSIVGWRGEAYRAAMVEQGYDFATQGHAIFLEHSHPGRGCD